MATERKLWSTLELILLYTVVVTHLIQTPVISHIQCVVLLQGSCKNNNETCLAGQVSHSSVTCDDFNKCCVDAGSAPSSPASSSTITVSSTVTSTLTPSVPPPEQPVSCGKRIPQTRIFGGMESKSICKWPWMVSLRHKIGSPDSTVLNLDNTQQFCNGVLIGKDRVVTSAYCLQTMALLVSGSVSDNLLVMAGDYHTSSLDVLGNTIRERFHRVDSVIIHPNNSNTNLESGTLPDTDSVLRFNLAIIKLREEVQLSECIQPICLPTMEDKTTAPSSESCMVASWGAYEQESTVASSTLRDGTVTLIKSDICGLIQQNFETTTTGNTCGRLGDFGDCVGDDGGMVACEGDDGSWKLKALLNSPRLSGECEGGGFNLNTFTDLLNHDVQQFIMSHMST